MMRRGALLLVGLLLLVSGCSNSGPICDDTSGKPVASCPEPNPEPAEPVKEPPPPSTPQQPTEANLIRWITVNGNPIDGESIEVPPEPTIVMIQFTELMNRGSVENQLRDLPAGTTFAWQAKDQVTAQVPAGGSFSLYLAGALSDDGRYVQDGKRSLRVSRLVATRVRLYDPDTALVGGPTLLESSLLVPDYAAFVISPDRRQAITYGGDAYVPPTDPVLIDLVTGKRTPLHGGPEDPLFCWVGWGPDGTSLMADFDGLWRVEEAHLIRWATSEERGCRSAVASPDGRYLSTWSPLRIFDLSTGSIVAVDGQFQPMAQDGGVNLLWSPAGDQIALGNAAQSGIIGGAIETVIVGLDGQIVRRIPDWWPAAWLADGDLIVFRWTASNKPERARLTSDGQPSPRPLPPDGTFSPDGRWVIPRAFGVWQLIELETGRQVVLPHAGGIRWLPDSTLLVFDQ